MFCDCPVWVKIVICYMNGHLLHNLQFIMTVSDILACKANSVLKSRFCGLKS